MKDKTDDTLKKKGIGKVSGRQRVTMQDIARLAGCSQPTVSLVLNDNQTVKISDATRARVLKAAERLGYQMPAKSAELQSDAQGFSAQTGGQIAFIVDSLATSPEMVNAFDGVMQAVKATGNIVTLAETRNDPAFESRIIRHFLDQKVAAIIYATVFTRTLDLPELLRQTATPVFMLNCFSEDLPVPSVVPGEVAGGHSATNALLRAGHRRIATITGEPHMECANGRTIGYRTALASADLPFEEELVFEGNWLPSSGYEGTMKLMALPKPPTAIFCQNDRMAIGCYEALKELGLSIPEDVSVIGYDDDETARHLSPPLTSMNLPTRAMGRWVIEQFLHGPSNPAARYPVTKLECELVERESIGPPKTSR